MACHLKTEWNSPSERAQRIEELQSFQDNHSKSRETHVMEPF